MEAWKRHLTPTDYVELTSSSGFRMTKQIVDGEERFVVVGRSLAGKIPACASSAVRLPVVLDTQLRYRRHSDAFSGRPYGFVVQPSDQKIVMAARNGICEATHRKMVPSILVSDPTVFRPVSGLSLVNSITVMTSGKI
jgi:hypothetical protein